MNRPRVLAVLALVAAFAAAGMSLTWLAADNDVPDSRGSSSDTVTVRNPLAEALHHIPRDATVVAAVATDTGNGPLRAALDFLEGAGAATTELGEQLDRLVSDRVGLTLSTDLAPLAGAPAVLALTGTAKEPTLLGAWVVPDAATLASAIGGAVASGKLQQGGIYRSATLFSGDGGVQVATSDRLLLAASDLKTLKTAVDRGKTASGLTTSAFTGRAASGVGSSAAAVRIALSGTFLRRLIADRLPNVSEVAWIAGIQGAGVGVKTDDTGMHLRMKLRVSQATVAEEDLPFATGATPPVVSGTEGVRIGVRELSQTASFAVSALRSVAPDQTKAYDQVRDMLNRFGQVDVERDIVATLKEDTTITVFDGAEVTLQAQTSDPEGVRSALQRLTRIGRLASLAGALGLGVDTGGLTIQDESADTGEDTYKLLRGEEPLAVVALRGDILVVSTDPDTDVDEAADTLEESVDNPGVRGALRATLTGPVLGGLLVNQVGLPTEVGEAFAGLGNPLLTARTQNGSMTIGLDLPPGE